jgi:hypothetical protein
MILTIIINFQTVRPFISIGVPDDIDDGLIEKNINTVHEIGRIVAFF